DTRGIVRQLETGTKLLIERNDVDTEFGSGRALAAVLRSRRHLLARTNADLDRDHLTLPVAPDLDLGRVAGLEARDRPRQVAQIVDRRTVQAQDDVALSQLALCRTIGEQARAKRALILIEADGVGDFRRHLL